MNKYGYKCSPSSKRKPKKKCSNKKLGIIMLLLGAMTILALFLPLKYWVLLLSLVLIISGIILIKN